MVIIIVQNPSSAYYQSSAIEKDMFCIDDEEWNLFCQLCEYIETCSFEVICGHGNDSMDLAINVDDICKRSKIVEAFPSKDVIEFVKKTQNRNFIDHVYKEALENDVIWDFFTKIFDVDFLDSKFFDNLPKFTCLKDYYYLYKNDIEKNKTDQEWLEKKQFILECRGKSEKEKNKYPELTTGIDDTDDDEHDLLSTDSD